MAKKVAKINRKKGCMYYVDGSGNVMEAELKKGQSKTDKSKTDKKK